MKKITLKDCWFEDHKVGDSGIFHAIAEALTIALHEKSWDNIITVGVSSETNEGIVKYKDSVLSDDPQYCDVLLGTIHLFSFFASAILTKCYVQKITTIEDYVEYALATINDMAEDEEFSESKEEAILSVVIPLGEYLPFIYACSEKLAYSRGRSLLGKTLKKMFDDMGLSFDNIERNE